mgnify:CR=1 FL=1
MVGVQPSLSAFGLRRMVWCWLAVAAVRSPVPREGSPACRHFHRRGLPRPPMRLVRRFPGQRPTPAWGGDGQRTDQRAGIEPASPLADVYFDAVASRFRIQLRSSRTTSAALSSRSRSSATSSRSCDLASRSSATSAASVSVALATSSATIPRIMANSRSPANRAHSRSVAAMHSDAAIAMASRLSPGAMPARAWNSR